MKAVIFLALLGLTLQMHLRHDQIDDQRTYVVFSNSLNNDKINGIPVTLNQGRISFHGCNYVSGQYQIEQDEKVQVSDNWISTLMYCQDDVDSLLTDLFKKVSSYSLNDGILDLKDSKGASLLTLH